MVIVSRPIGTRLCRNKKIMKAKTKQQHTTIRAYTIRLYANPSKAEQTLGNMVEYRAWLWDYVTRYYRKGEDATESTKGRGGIANQAFKRARDLLRAGRNASIATGVWFNCPRSLPLLCDGILEENKTSSFDYWVKVANGPRLPAQTHKALKNALRKGGVLRPTCEIRCGKRALVARVFVEFPVASPPPSRDYLGVDVGVNAGVARSDGYIGKSLRPALDRNRQKRAEQQRQGHVRSSARSAVKQILDHEAKRLVTLARRCNKIVVLERSQALANLKPTGSIGAWARQHLGRRVSYLAEIDGVAVCEEWPAGTSITCEVCGYAHKKNRRGVRFCCIRCAHVTHADGLASRNIQRRARGVFPFEKNEKAALETQDRIDERSPEGNVL